MSFKTLKTMRWLFFVITVFSVTFNVNASQCNYVVDYFWTAVHAPTSAPTDAPSPSPTDSPTPAPTKPPTRSPLATGETHPPVPSPTAHVLTLRTTMQLDNGSPGDTWLDAHEALLKPMTFDYCYSFPNNKFYFGDFSLKYQCDSSNNLVRKIYYNALECDSDNPATLTVQNWEMGQYHIRYVCNEAENCEFTKLINTTATTPEPTPAPSPSPTMSPTPGPTMSPTTSPLHVGNEYPTIRPTLRIGMVTTDYINYGEINTGGGDGNWWEECDGITAGMDSSDKMISYFVEDICVKANYFDDVFYNYYADNEYFGWYCDTNKKQYFMGVFRDSKCTDMSYQMIAYTNDQCIPKAATNDYYKAYWTYVECAVGDITNRTPSPATSPVILSPATMPAIMPTDPQGNEANCVDFIYLILSMFVVQFVF